MKSSEKILFTAADVDGESTPEVCFNLGISCVEMEDFLSAEHCFRRALKLAPESVEAMLNLGYALDMLGRSEEALECYDSVLKISPKNAKALYNRASHLLRRGDLVAGFSDYESRFSAIKSADSRTYRQPRWDGSDLNVRSILVYCEQGLGDAIQFGRYVPLLAERGGRVILEVQEPLVTLMRSLEGVDQVIPKSSTPPLTDVHIPLLSLPHIFKTTAATIPANVPYLAAPEALVSTWKSRIGNDSGEFRVGLSWAGKEKPYPNRSCPPDLLLPLLSIQGVSFYSLQIGEQERFSLSSEFSAKLVDLTQDILDFSDTAALLANLDLVITIDTAVAHLAGALGKTVWVMLPYDSDWRWMVNRDDSPWYPTARLFRQREPGDWETVVCELGCALQVLLSHTFHQVEPSSNTLDSRLKTALVLLDDNEADAAIAELRNLLLLVPDDPAVWFNLGRAYEMISKAKEATLCYRQALLQSPDHPVICFHLGVSLLNQKTYPEAECYLRKAHKFRPESIEILSHLGATLVQQGKTAEAFECCRKMLVIRPDSAEARFNQAYLLLRTGNYLDGFANFEARLLKKSVIMEQRPYQQPRWDGSPLNGKSILLFGEQGMGDVIQFARYIPMVIERGGKVIFEVDPPLVPLFDKFPGVTQVVPKSETPPLADVYAYTLSLPHIFGTTLETVPNQVPYIVPDQAKVAGWGKLLSGDSGYRIGLVWRGNPKNPTDHDRSCPLATFLPLADFPGVRFFSLQVGAGTDEITPLKADMELVDYTDRLEDFSDTAALIANLDLVIGIDTAVIHLAGAMGKPVWVMLPHIYDWRWLIDRDDTPWYPATRVFWQKSSGDWNGVMARVKDALMLQLNSKVLDQAPLDIESCYNLGAQLKEDGDLAGAERRFREIVDHSPDLPDPQHSLGVVLHLQGRLDEAIRHYRSAVDLDPIFVQAHYNLANALLLLGRYQESIQAVQMAIHCDPDHADSHWLLGMLLLQQGDFRKGWKEYEWRWKAKEFKFRFPDLGCPEWDGSPMQNKTLLIHMEQGRGDMIQFVRFARSAKARGAKVLTCATEELISLLACTEGVDEALDRNMPLPDFDFHIPALSLPHALNATPEDLPGLIPYITPDPIKVDTWRRLLSADDRFRIGLVWQGSPDHRDDRNRSCSLSTLKALADLPHVNFYSMQLGCGSEQVNELAAEFAVIDHTDRIRNFADSAALMQNLDLVISVDTAVAHLAGAIGKPVWLMLPYVSEWRWMLERDDTPWYPSMVLMRQPSPGNWHEVAAKIRVRLMQLLNDAGIHNQHGIDQLNRGLLAEAERAFALAIAIDRDNAEAYCNLGVTLDAGGEYEGAVDCYRKAINCNPDYMHALFNMGNSYMAMQKTAEACACYGRVLELTPCFAPAMLCLAEIAKTKREFEKALDLYLRILSMDPACLEALQGKAEICQATEKFEQAVAAYRQVLALDSGRTAAWNMLGTTYHAMDMLEDAETCYRNALQLQPDRVTMLNNLAVVLNARGKLDEAVLVYRRLLEIDDGYAEGHWNLSTALLARGEYLEGWREYEWRFSKTRPVPERDFLQPRWDGSPLAGKTILLHAEQGFGDTIQFARYVPLLVKSGARVVVECQTATLKRLLMTLEGVADVIVAGDALPGFDCHLPLLSLPFALGTTFETIPAGIPYLYADAIDIDVWRKRLGRTDSIRIGIVWFGRQSLVLNRKRSCPLTAFEPLTAVSGVEFHSLQIGEGCEQLRKCKPDFIIRDFTEHICDFADTAAYIANLDIVISIDTAVAHLAAAIGTETWVLLPVGADWRWHGNNEGTPWYPAAKLFRQPVPGDWQSVMLSVAETLDKFVAGSGNKPVKDATFSASSQNPPPCHGVQVSGPRSTSRLRVGLAWSCRQDNPVTLNRICPFSALAPLLKLPGVTFFSLQLGTPLDISRTAPLIDLTDHISDFEDTAAFVSHLDLVISIDTSVAHLAASTGRPTWVILPHAAEWRWMQNRTDSPWYPGMKLFRQPDFGNWDSVIRMVAQELSCMTGISFDSSITMLHSRDDSTRTKEREDLENDLGRRMATLSCSTVTPDDYLNAGASLALLGRFDEASLLFQKVIDLAPDHITGHMNLAYSLLACGRLAEGFAHHEWRLGKIMPGLLPDWPMLQPGMPGRLNNSSLLVHCEQGYGDSIQFARYLPLLADIGYRITVSCQPPLASLFTSLRGVARVIPHGELLPKCDYQILMLSLPHIFSTTLADIPAALPYLAPGLQRINAWKTRLDALQSQCQIYF